MYRQSIFIGLFLKELLAFSCLGYSIKSFAHAIPPYFKMESKILYPCLYCHYMENHLYHYGSLIRPYLKELQHCPVRLKIFNQTVCAHNSSFIFKMEFLKHFILNNPWYYYIKICIPFQQFGCTISKGVVSLFLTLYKKKIL